MGSEFDVVRWDEIKDSEGSEIDAFSCTNYPQPSRLLPSFLLGK